MSTVEITGKAEGNKLVGATSEARFRYGQKVTAMIGGVTVEGEAKESKGKWVIEIPLTECGAVRGEFEETLVTKREVVKGWVLV